MSINVHIVYVTAPVTLFLCAGMSTCVMGSGAVVPPPLRPSRCLDHLGFQD